MPRGIAPIFRKRLRTNIASGRLVLSAVLVALLATVTASVAFHQHRLQKELYEAELLAYRFELESQSLRTYSQVRIILGWEPPPLGVFAAGVASELSPTAILRGQYGRPTLEQRAQGNLVQTEHTFGLAPLAGLVLSLASLVMTFDVIVGERVRGRMDLVRAHAVTWRGVLVGEHLAAVVSLLPATALVVLVAVVGLVAADGIDLGAPEWVGLAVQWGLMVGLVAAFSALGILCSASSRSRGGSLVLAFTLWVVLVACYPDLVAWGIQGLGEGGRTSGRAFSQSGLLVQLEPREESRRGVAATDLDPLSVRDEPWRARRGLWAAAPFTAYQGAVSVIAGTDFSAYQRFLDGARDVDERLAAWQRDKVAEHPEREASWTWESGLLDLDGLPPPETASDPSPTPYRRLVPDVIALLLWTLAPLGLALRLTEAREPE